MIQVFPIPWFLSQSDIAYIYVLRDEDKKQTVIIDPGSSEAILHFLEEKSWQPDYALITHHHADHIAALPALQEKFPSLKVITSSREPDIFPSAEKVDLDTHFSCGSLDFWTMSTPGHTQGHICFYLKNQEILFSGDTLFLMGCGRVCSYQKSRNDCVRDLYNSLCSIAQLPDHTKIYCGHEYTVKNSLFALSLFSGESLPKGSEYERERSALQIHTKIIEQKLKREKSTIPGVLSEEKRFNPFLRCSEPLIQKVLEYKELASSRSSHPAETFAFLCHLKDHSC